MSHVLIVQSSPWLLAPLDDILQNAGYDTATARSSEDAIAALENKLPGVIVLDEALQGAGGIELIHELRSYPDWLAIPVILCVQLDDTQLITFKRSFKAYGIVSILQKSNIQPHQLVEAVEEAISHATKKD